MPPLAGPPPMAVATRQLAEIAQEMAASDKEPEEAVGLNPVWLLVPAVFVAGFCKSRERLLGHRPGKQHRSSSLPGLIHSALMQTYASCFGAGVTQSSCDGRNRR
jgi:hypothetical protein